MLMAVASPGMAASKPPASVDARQFASILMTRTASGAVVERKTGFVFSTEPIPTGTAGEVIRALRGDEYRDGRRVESFGGGTESATFVASIANVGLVPFDFDAEVAQVTARLSREAEQRGDTFLEPQGRDGNEWEITIATQAGMFTLRAWNPRASIDAYAPYSDKLARLKAVLDLLAQYYGRLKVGP
jgi:hypothetical protein